MNSFKAAVVAVLSFICLNSSASASAGGPSDGPQQFTNTVYGYRWVFLSTSNRKSNQCHDCVDYAPSLNCGPGTVNLKMKFRKIGTVNDTLNYQCLQFEGDQFYSLPAGGPGSFSNTVYAYRWKYVFTDTNGCNECADYSPSYRCDQNTAGRLKLKFRQPGTHNNDYKYECVRSND